MAAAAKMAGRILCIDVPSCCPCDSISLRNQCGGNGMFWGVIFCPASPVGLPGTARSASSDRGFFGPVTGASMSCLAALQPVLCAAFGCASILALSARERCMQGLMQRHELLISSIIAHAARHHGDGEIISRRADGSLARTTYRAIEERARRLVAVLQALGVKSGDRVGTLAMNSDRHMELYYGISGMGAVCNTINPRLLPDDIAYILEHAEDGVLFCDPQLLPIVAAIALKVRALRAVVVLDHNVSPA